MRRVSSLVVTCLILLSLVSALPTLAQSPPPGAPVGSYPSDSLGPNSTGPGGVQAEGVEGDGATCGASSQNPHGSSHKRGRVNAIVLTRCPINYPTINVYPWLKHKNNNGNWVTDAQGPPTLQNEYIGGVSPWAARVSVSTSCPNNRTSYRAEGYHAVTFPNGKTGFTWTGNTQSVECG